ncbi:collagen alpha-1(III) chain [Chelonia mydas]|uniref:collagen alpha-1(III) chain n=1 Tax=Chelonia mydas TaxID=8469 RepID=UPI001CA934DB|nr:collagen alpha-1(III) chain [Chelonia mydas]
MIIARPMERPQGEPLGPRTAHAPPELELTRLIPLELVSLYLHDMGEQRLKLRLATGRVYYLKLCAPRGEERPLFARWLRLIYLLRAPPDSWASIPSWHTSDLRGRSAKPPHSQRLRPIQEEEEPRAPIPQLGEPPGSGSRTPSQGQLRGRQRPASPTTGQQPSTRSVGGQGSTCSTSPSTALVRRSPKLLDGLSGSRAEVTSPWTQGPMSRELSAERNRGQLSLAIPSGSRSPAGTPSQRGSSAGSRATMAPGSPERSRASVGMGRSAVGTASVGVGRSAVAMVSAAAGPSWPASAQPSGMGGEMEPGERCKEPSTETRQDQSGCASPSTEQGRSCSQSQRGSNAASRAAVAPGSPERSRASVGVGRSAVGTASVGVGRSAVATVSAAAGPSRPTSAQPSGMGREMEPGERCREPSTETRQAQSGCASPSTEQGRSCSQSQRGSNAASRAAVAPSSPERSRASVGVGRSAGGTASVGVGRSLPSTASVAVGPSKRASTQPSGMEPDRRSGERSRAQLGHTSPSMEQGRSCSRSQQGSSAAPGPTRATVTPSSHGQPSSSRAPSFPEPASSPMAAAAPPERSQLSGGVGPSEVATAALSVDPSGQRSRNSSGLHRAERQGRRSRETVGESSKGKARSSSGSPSHKRPSK